MSTMLFAQRQAVVGNALVLGLLVVLALTCAAWQKTVLAWHYPGATRLVAAAFALLGFVAFVALLRRRRLLAAQESDAGAVDGTRLVVYASQTGMAQELALRTQRLLADADWAARLLAIDQLDMARLCASRCVLFIVSTYGEGDPPDMAVGFARRLLASKMPLNGLRYGVLALGDSEYADFCGFGRHLDTWLRQQGAQALFDRIDVDNADPGTLRQWQRQLGIVTGRSEAPDWSPPRYARWRLVERRELNPGSLGEACFLLALQAPAGEAAHWDAGDIAEIGPRHAPDRVSRQLARCGLHAGQQRDDGEDWADYLARHHWPELPPAPAETAAWLAGLKPLPHREYSIASIPQDGRLELVVRRWRRPDGSLGLGSGWLTQHAQPGDCIDLRLRGNQAFHVPAQDCPLILVGNGTGIAALRALLRQRAAAGQGRNWLLFGERQRERDYFFADEIRAWQHRGLLERVDLAFSRDQTERIYVQQRLREAAPTLREWVAAGACLYVCGSLQGMAPAVDAELRTALGHAGVDALLEQGRYRRDVY